MWYQNVMLKITKHSSILLHLLSLSYLFSTHSVSDVCHLLLFMLVNRIEIAKRKTKTGENHFTPLLHIYLALARLVLIAQKKTP